MRRIDIDNNTCETFDSVRELLDTLDRRNYVYDYGYHRGKKEHYDYSWTGYRSYTTAARALTEGKAEDVQAMDVKTTANAGGTRPHMTRTVVGCLPCVPASIIGLPNAMYKRKAARVNNPVVVLNVDCAQNCFATVEDMREYGRKCVSLIKALETRGKRVRVYCCECMNYDNERAVLRLLVKHESAPLDIKRLTFPICDAAMLRIIGFEWYEKTRLYTHSSGYGRAVDTGDTQSIDFIKACDRNAIYINHNTDFDALTF